MITAGMYLLAAYWLCLTAAMGRITILEIMRWRRGCSYAGVDAAESLAVFVVMLGLALIVGGAVK